MKLILEGRPDIRDVTNDDVLEAIEAMASPHGPTFVILEDDQRNYTQAAGTDGRYVIESRDVYGEGFTHWRAMRDGAGEGAATIRYRQRCPKGKHPPRGCPLKVRAGEVFSLSATSRRCSWSSCRQRLARRRCGGGMRRRTSGPRRATTTRFGTSCRAAISNGYKG